MGLCHGPVMATCVHDHCLVLVGQCVSAYLKGSVLTQSRLQEDQALLSSKRLMASALDREQSQTSLQVHHGFDSNP